VGGTLSGGQGSGPLAMNAQKDGQQALHLYRQLYTQIPLNVLPTGGNLPSQPCKEDLTNNSVYSIRAVG
jgi:hypothetical protein